VKVLAAAREKVTLKPLVEEKPKEKEEEEEED
jgi:hypothetical protein